MAQVVADSSFYMGEVARLAKVLSVARRESPNSDTVRAVENAYKVAVKRYTNPFNVNKYVQ